MADFAIAHAVHVLAVILWIGGVGFVTLVLIPSLEETPPNERMASFHQLESRFAPLARMLVLLAGASGFWMVWRAAMWDRFAEPRFWWMHAMVAVWAAFAVMLFILEPLVLDRRMARSPSPEADFAKLRRIHQFLLVISLVAAGGAAAGSHGF